MRCDNGDTKEQMQKRRGGRDLDLKRPTVILYNIGGHKYGPQWRSAVDESNDQKIEKNKNRLYTIT